MNIRSVGSTSTNDNDNNNNLGSKSVNLSPTAPVFVPSTITRSAVAATKTVKSEDISSATATISNYAEGNSASMKKEKKQRSGPRKRRRHKEKEKDYLDFDTSDLLERSSQGSNKSGGRGRTSSGSYASSGRRDRENSYVPLYRYGLSPQNMRNSDGTSDINDDWDGLGVASDWLTELIGGQALRDIPDRSKEWLEMQAEWSLSKQVFSSSASTVAATGGATSSSGSGTSSGMGSEGMSEAPDSRRQVSHEDHAGGTGAPTGAPTAGGVQIPLQSLSTYEEDERKRWSDWAISAAEMERRRRVLALEEIDRAESVERLRRRKWAINAIEVEQNERVSSNFLTNLASTNWFHEAIFSQNNKNYEVVCPYYMAGCRETCKKSNIEAHIKVCAFSYESHNNTEILDQDYEVVCPNSILGCRYIGGKLNIQKHLSDECGYKGKTKQEEQEERHILRQFVISECEEERVRRLIEDKDKSKSSSKMKTPLSVNSQNKSSALSGSISENPHSDSHNSHVLSDSEVSADEKSSKGYESAGSREEKSDQNNLTLHRFMEKQMNEVVSRLHNEALHYWQHWRKKQDRRRPVEAELIQQVQLRMKQLWAFASLEPFGSWATGLPGVRSDIDLVVCFEDDIFLTMTPTSRYDLVEQLASYFESHAKDLITINKVLLHTRVPLIKASAQITIPSSSPECGDITVTVELDISIDGPEHSGLATTSLTQAMLKSLPGLGPATLLIKEYLKEKGLCDSFTGGLASYGVFLLVLLLFLRRHHANQLMCEEESDVEHLVEVPVSGPVTGVIDDGRGEGLGMEGRSYSDETTMSAKTDNTSRSHAPSRKNSGILDKSFSSSLNSEQPSSRSLIKSEDLGDIEKDETSDRTNSQRCDSDKEVVTGSDPSLYSFINVKQQKEYGRRVAAKLLLSSSEEDQEKKLSLLEASLTAASDDISDTLEPAVPLKCPMLGVIVVEFLGVYGEELQCGLHGFSVRDGGFRFDVRAGPYTIAHPQANDPLLIEDPVNVMNNVAKNCFNALSVQRVFLEAHDNFKNVVTRYSGKGKVGGSTLSIAKGESVIEKMFGLSVLKAEDKSSVNFNTINGHRIVPESLTGIATSDSDLNSKSPPKSLLYRKNQTKYCQESDQTKSSSVRLMPDRPLVDDFLLKKSNKSEIIGNAFRQVLHEMLLNQTPDISVNNLNDKIEESLQRLHLAPTGSPSRKYSSKAKNGRVIDGAGGDNVSLPSTLNSAPASRRSSYRRPSLTSSLSTVKERSDSF